LGFPMHHSPSGIRGGRLKAKFSTLRGRGFIKRAGGPTPPAK